MRNRGGGIGRIAIGLIIAAISVVSFLSSQEYNPVTGENQYVSLTVEQEISLGRQSAPELIQQFGGMYSDEQVQDDIDEIGYDIVNNSIAQDTPWEFEFHVLADSQTINAFALPGGQVFITVAMLSEFDSVDQVAGVLSHEIVHVLARHGAQRLAKNELTNGLVGAVGVATGEAGAAQTAAVIGQLVNMQYGREDELESDTLGICLMIQSGYDPQGMIGVMQVLEEATSGPRPPEFFSTHPSPDNRIESIQDAINSAPENCPTELDRTPQ